MMKLDDLVHCTKISPRVAFGGQRSKVEAIRTKKTKKCGIFFRSRSLGRRPLAAVFCERPIAVAATSVGKSAHAV